jgi:nicotinate-nucleotide pyrophosphorylase (carboxylating)
LQILTSPILPASDLIEHDVQRALAEDIGSGDATADLIPPHAIARAHVITREAAVLAGQTWFEACFRTLDPQVAIHWNAHDGEQVAANATLCTLRGNARALVSGERCALNFLQTLSATATVTAQYVDAVRGTRTKILDTR